MQQRVDQDSEGNVPEHSERDVDAGEDRAVVLGDRGIRQVQGDAGVLRDVCADDGGRGRPVPRVHRRGRVLVPAPGRAGQRAAAVDAVDAGRRRYGAGGGDRLLRVSLRPERDHVLFGDAVRRTVFLAVLQAEDRQQRRRRAGPVRRIGAHFETLAVRRECRSRQRCSDTRRVRRRCCRRAAAGRAGRRRGDRRRCRDAADQTLAAARSHRLSEQRVRRATRHVGVRGVRDVVFRHLLRDVSRHGQIRHVRPRRLLLDAALRFAVHGNNPDVALHHEAG